MEKRKNVLSLLSFSADGSVRGGVPAGAFAGMCVSGGRVVREREKEICYLGSILQLSFVFFLAPGLRWFSFHCWDMLRRAEEHLHQTQMVAHNCIKPTFRLPNKNAEIRGWKHLMKMKRTRPRDNRLIINLKPF